MNSASRYSPPESPTADRFRDAEARAQKAEARLRELETIIDIGNIGILEWPDVDTEAIVLSQNFLQGLGYGPDAFESNRSAMRQIVHPEDRDLVADKFAEAITGLTHRKYTVRLQTAEGAYRWYETNIRAFRRTDRSPVSAIATIQDVHEAVSLQVEYAGLVEQLNFVIKASGAGVYDWPDIRNSFIEIQPSMSQLLGLAEGEAVNDVSWFWSLIHPADAPGVQDALDRAFADPGGAFDSVYRIRFTPAGYRYVRSLGLASRLSGGKSFRLTGALFDVHDAYLDKRRAAEAHEQLTQFSYVVAHDLVAPLRQLGGYTAILREDYGSTLDPVALRHLDTMETTAQNAQLLIGDLLEFGRLGTAALRFVSVPVQPIVEGLTQMLDPTGRVSWRVGTLPTVTGDRTQLTMLFQNLLANAVKFSSRLDRQPEISITAGEARGNEVAIVVSDNGVGFDPSHAAKIFGAFERAHTREEFEGSGIGLANVARIVERHNGTIEASGTVGGGASFVVTLPRGTEA